MATLAELRSIRHEALMRLAMPSRAESEKRQAINRIVELSLASLEQDLNTPVAMDRLYVCGHTAGNIACSHMLAIMSDGTQQRGRRAVAIRTLREDAAQEGIPISITMCDNHNGIAFPPTDAIREAYGIPNGAANLQERSS